MSRIGGFRQHKRSKLSVVLLFQSLALRIGIVEGWFYSGVAAAAVALYTELRMAGLLLRAISL